jgi:copper chaperone CopZ
VAEVKVNVPARLVQVGYDDDRVTAEEIKAAIEAAGYSVQRYSDGKR